MNRQQFVRLILVVSLGLMPLPCAAQVKAAANPVPTAPEPITSASPPRSPSEPPFFGLQQDMAGLAPGDRPDMGPLPTVSNSVQGAAPALPASDEIEVRSVAAEDTPDETSTASSPHYHLSLAGSPLVEQDTLLLETPVGGVITQSTTWSLAGSPYLVTADVLVQNGVTLTVEAGVEVRFDLGGGLFVRGALRAIGTAAQPITFTSSSASPAPGDWDAIFFDAESDDARNVLEYVTVSYAGFYTAWHRCDRTGIGVYQASPTIRHTTVRYSAGDGLCIEDSSPTLSYNTFTDNSGDGASTFGGAPTFSYCTFIDNNDNGALTYNSSPTLDHCLLQENGGDGLEVLAQFTAISPTLEANTFISNTGYAIYMQYSSGGGLPLASGNTAAGNGGFDGLAVGGTVNYSLTLPRVYDLPLVIAPDLVVYAGRELTVEPGTEVLFARGGSVYVRGALRAVGTPTQPITFTSSSASPAPGDWDGILFDDDSDDARNVLEYVTLSYAGFYTAWPSCGRAGIGVYQASPTIRHTTVRYSAGHGLCVRNSTLRIDECTLENNRNAGIRVQNSTVIAQDNTIGGNTDFGIENVSSTPVVRATYNWWGHTSGPYHPLDNPDGQGDAVSDYVVFEPWLVSPTARQPLVLSLGQAVTGTVGPFDYQDYRLDTSAGLSLLVEVTPLSDSPTLWVYGRLGDLPLWTLYDLRALEPASSGAYELLITPTQSGSYYFSVYGRDVPGSGASYRLVVNTVGRRLSAVSPASAGNAGEITLSLSGLPFVEGMGVQLRSAGLPALAADQITLVSPTALWAHLALSGTVAGLYDVYAIWPDSGEAGLAQAFTVASGVGPRLDARLVAPSSLRPLRDYVLWLEYGNSGDADMPAPLFLISSPENAPMRLSRSELYTTGPVQVLGINFDQPAGVLGPGSHYRIPVYFQTPNTDRLHFNLKQMVASSTAIDWNTLETEVRPPGMQPDLWAAIWPSFKTRMGNTWADYLRALDDQATYLTRYGTITYDVGELFSVALQRVTGTYVQRTLAGSLDAYSPARGLPLSFSRTAFDSLEQRFTVSPLGRGWSHDYEYALTRPDASTAIVEGPAGIARRFFRQPDGSWQALAGDSGLLQSMPDGSYRLRETDGLVWQFHATGRLASSEEPNGNRVTLGYDALGHLTGLSHSNGQSLALQYNAQGRIQRLTDHAGQVTEYVYDASGEHLISVLAPGGITTTYAYNIASGSPANHALTTITYADGTQQHYAYDAQGRLAAQWRDGDAERIEFSYDALGTVWAEDASHALTTLRLGGSSQPLEIQDPLGNRLGLQYDEDLNLIRVVQPGGSTSASYDNLGNPIQTVDALGYATTMGYTTGLSRLDWLRDARGNLSDFAYDGAGNLTGITYPDGSTEAFGYDHSGNLVSLTNRRGQSITLSYNSQGQVTDKTYPDGRTIAYTYDARGNLLSANDSATGAIHIQYDARSFLTRIEYPGGQWFSFEYNSAGRRTRRTGHDADVLNYQYDAAGRLERLTDGSGDEIVRYAYDANGRLAREDKGNGTYSTYEYDAAGQLLRLVNHAPDGAVQSRFDYTYDATGNRTSMTTLSGTTTYDYDALGQLVGVAYPAGRHVTYTYDAVGNRVTVSDNGAATPYTTNNMNQYTRVGPAAYTYDADGNMTSQTDTSGTTTYEYDAENRLVRVVVPGGDTWEYTYDALGNRVAVNHSGTVIRYVHDPVGLVDVAAEYDGSDALVARYVHGLGLVARMDAAGQPAYYSFDATGHARQMTDDAGAVASTYDYDPFGIPAQTTEAIPNPFRYAAQFGVMTEEHGLSYMRARYYCPATGRFASVEPLRFVSEANLYRYARNSPTVAIDPSGTLPVVIFAPAILATLHLHRLWVRLMPQICWYGPKVIDVMSQLSPFPSDPTTKAGMAAAVGLVGWRNLGTLLPWIGWFLYNLFGPLNPDWWTSVLGLGMGEVGSDDTNCIPCHPQAPPPDPPARNRGSTSSYIERSTDPNEKVGPVGAGPLRLISANQEHYYTLYFENVITATAPAQEVFVSDYLDPGLDWHSFQVGEVAFGDEVIATPEGAGQFHTRATIPDYRSEVSKSWWVDINAQLNYATGQVNWTFRTLDPETEALPEDALAGFLPPNDATGRGEGHVSFSIRPKAGLALGTVITNSASIIFDVNEPIQTNVVSNTIGLVTDLALTKEASPQQAPVGSALTYTLQVRNNGADAASSAVVTDVLPAGVAFSWASASQGTCTGTSIVVCSLGTIANGADAAVTIAVTRTAQAALTNTATVTSDVVDADMANNQATLTIAGQGSWVFLPVVLKKY